MIRTLPGGSSGEISSAVTGTIFAGGEGGIGTSTGSADAAVDVEGVKPLVRGLVDGSDGGSLWCRWRLMGDRRPARSLFLKALGVELVPSLTSERLRFSLGGPLFAPRLSTSASSTIPPMPLPDDDLCRI